MAGVGDGHLVAGAVQGGYDMGSDETGSTGHEYVCHGADGRAADRPAGPVRAAPSADRKDFREHVIIP
ncbi:hypothetical protein Axi01nite_88940 [Actinoplanes xinjiangensis]|nr:hypothetical protein Axi01nite_88940 [Actinoplanes xinjiangensis]